MDSQAEDVIIMAHVETLGILLSVVHNPNSGYMVDYLTGLGVEQVAPAIITPVAAKKKCFVEKDYTKGFTVILKKKSFSTWNSS